jgi:hypothetical protein
MSEFRCGVMSTRYRPRMKRKHPISEEHRRCTTARNPVRNRAPDRAVKLEKQYEELCRLREQVQIAESRQRVLSHGLSHGARR